MVTTIMEALGLSLHRELTSSTYVLGKMKLVVLATLGSRT